MTEIVKKREDELKAHTISDAQFKALPERDKVEIKYARKLGRKLGVAQIMAAAKDKACQIRRAVKAYLCESRSNHRLPAKSIASALQKEPVKYFEAGIIPYKSDSKFLREVGLALAVVRPRRGGKSPKS